MQLTEELKFGLNNKNVLRRQTFQENQQDKNKTISCGKKENIHLHWFQMIKVS